MFKNSLIVLAVLGFAILVGNPVYAETLTGCLASNGNLSNV